MRRRVLVAAGLAMLLSVTAAAEMPEGYLDITIARVKPDKRAEFDAINKKMVEANRKYHGDTWLAQETTYGENNVVTFVSYRSSYADVKKGFGAFMGALSKAYPGGADRFFQEFNNTVVSPRSEFRRRRWTRAPTSRVIRRPMRKWWANALAAHGQNPREAGACA